jgi:hypothetical protein
MEWNVGFVKNPIFEGMWSDQDILRFVRNPILERMLIKIKIYT